MAKEMLIKYKDVKGREVVLSQAVFLVNTKHPDGTPALCTQLSQSRKIDLAGGEELMTAWVPYNMRTE